MIDIVKKAINMALGGDRQMLKLLLELHMSKAVMKEDESGGKSQVAIVIQNLTEKPKPLIIEAHTEVLSSDGHE